MMWSLQPFLRRKIYMSFPKTLQPLKCLHIRIYSTCFLVLVFPQFMNVWAFLRKGCFRIGIFCCHIIYGMFQFGWLSNICKIKNYKKYVYIEILSRYVMLIFVIYSTQPYKLSLNISIKRCLLDFNNETHNYFDDTFNV